MSASSGFSSFMVPPGMPRQPNDSKESSSVNATNYNPYEMFFKQRALPNMLPLEESKVIAAKKRNEIQGSPSLWSSWKGEIGPVKAPPVVTDEHIVMSSGRL